MVIAAKQYTYQRSILRIYLVPYKHLDRSEVVRSKNQQTSLKDVNGAGILSGFICAVKEVTENLPVKENRVMRADDLSLARSCCADKIGAIEPSVPQRAARSSIRDVLKVRVQ